MRGRTTLARADQDASTGYAGGMSKKRAPVADDAEPKPIVWLPGNNEERPPRPTMERLDELFAELAGVRPDRIRKPRALGLALYIGYRVFGVLAAALYDAATPVSDFDADKPSHMLLAAMHDVNALRWNSEAWRRMLLIRILNEAGRMFHGHAPGEAADLLPGRETKRDAAWWTLEQEKRAHYLLTVRSFELVDPALGELRDSVVEDVLRRFNPEVEDGRDGFNALAAVLTVSVRAFGDVSRAKATGAFRGAKSDLKKALQREAKQSRQPTLFQPKRKDRKA